MQLTETESRAKFFVVAGTDGSGKATQSAMLKELLEKKGHNVSLFEFPNYNSFYGKLIGRYLNGEFGDPTQLDPYIVSVLYAEDRRHMRKQIMDGLNNNNIIIANRYIESNIAHQSIKLPQEKQGEFEKWLYDLEYNINKLPKPTISFFLYLPYSFRRRLMKERLKNTEREYTNKMDGHESNENYQLLVEKKYFEIAEKEKWVIIDVMKNNKIRDKKDILNEIYDKLLDFL